MFPPFALSELFYHYLFIHLKCDDAKCCEKALVLFVGRFCTVRLWSKLDLLFALDALAVNPVGG